MSVIVSTLAALSLLSVVVGGSKTHESFMWKGVFHGCLFWRHNFVQSKSLPEVLEKGRSSASLLEEHIRADC